MCNIRHFYLLRELYEADFHKPSIYGIGRIWTNAWDVVFRAMSRGGRGRRAAVDFVVCFGRGGFFSLVFSMSLHLQIRTSRAISVDEVKGMRQPVNLPTENARPPISTMCTV